MEKYRTIEEAFKELREAETSTDFDIEEIRPERKDWERATGLKFSRGSFYGSNRPFASEAHKMAALIKDTKKLVRRAMAVYAMYGTSYHASNTGYYDPHYINPEDMKHEVWDPFEKALQKAGFSNKQIDEIKAVASRLTPPVDESMELSALTEVLKLNTTPIRYRDAEIYSYIDSENPKKAPIYVISALDGDFHPGVYDSVEAAKKHIDDYFYSFGK